MNLTVLSRNAGLRTYEILRDNEAYRSRDVLLKKLFLKYGVSASQYDVYEELQGIDRSVNTGLREEDIHSLKKLAATMSKKWNDCFTDTGNKKWWVFSAECADPSVPRLSNSGLIKVYASVRDVALAPDIFCQAVRLILTEGDKRFYAKVSRIKRKDAMCFWVSKKTFEILEGFFAGCGGIIGDTMPFIAYRGKLGISRELASFDSHNFLQARLISSYFHSVNSANEVDLGDMYSLILMAWNADLSVGHPVMNTFQYSKAQEILLLLDTMDVLTGRTLLNDDHCFLQENEQFWLALGKATRWEQVEQYYQRSNKE